MYYQRVSILNIFAMAHQESPVRINASLLSQAQAASEVFHRSVPEQITYWAEIGRLMESQLSPEQISYLKSGLARFTVETVTPAARPAMQRSAIDIVAMARKSQDKRETLAARRAVMAKNTVRYQASRQHPGLLEQISPSGDIRVGQFKNGKFKKARLGAA